MTATFEAVDDVRKASEVGRLLRPAVTAIAVTMALYHMWFAAFPPPEALIFRGTHLAFATTLVFLLYRSRSLIADATLLVLSLTSTFYLFVEYDYVVNRIPYIDDLEWADKLLAVIAIATVLEGTRRVIGWALPATALAFLAYALLISGVEAERLLDQLYLTTEGIFGSTLGVSATYVIVFVLFGAFMERTGTGQLFMDFALSLTGRSAGGPGKVSVISSSLFGTVSGSAVANVMVDGPITIPLMKRSGFRPPFAAAVEAVASTGGQILPPVMGAAAFVMAEFLGVSYLQVTIWAAIPAILYYVAVFFAVHFEAKRANLKGLPDSEVPRVGTVMRRRGHLFVPAGVVLGVIVAGYSAPLAALYGTLATVPMALLRGTTRAGIGWRTLLGALEDGAKAALGVAMACACAGIVIGVITLTGLGITFTALVINLAFSSLLLALLLTMVAGIILGMGMPTTPAYIVMVSLLVPALVKLGVTTPAAHMFAFYFAIMSAITPPVALAVYAAAGLAKADLWSSGWAAMKIGAAGFIVPFMFVYDPSLMIIGEWHKILFASATACLGIIALAASLHGWLLRGLAMWQRAVLMAAAFTLVMPGLIESLVGFGLLASILLLQRFGPGHARAG